MAPSSRITHTPFHKDKIISNNFFEPYDEFTVLDWRPQSPDLKPTEPLWDEVE
ncbi:hypothetical protein EXN66_Car009312 [Channa argus]|uniref:Uncharacterized protein n=1 Tax=Channa argus TaxID=215402 RepID=A0A6G1PUG7_CHAAH|nr:hypothetical protein EXN66_Car009312 [Channa argus]